IPRQAAPPAGTKPFSALPIDMVRIGYVGIGGQGGGHVNNLLKIPGCRITAVCDIRPERTDWATPQITAAGHPAPAVYNRGRRAWATKVNGNLYPTHGLGPVANCLDINRGDRFDYIVSMSGPSRGLQAWAAEHEPPDSPKRREKYVLGDVNVSLIKTVQGRTIIVQHSTNLPRPYSRIHLVQGTKGLFQGYPHRAYIEGRGKLDQWQTAEELLAEFEHPLWKEIAERAQGAGHGGMDFIEDYRLIKCLREGTPTDMNVYDAASLSAVVELSVQSVGRKSAPVDFPDFTRGRWKTQSPLPIVHM